MAVIKDIHVFDMLDAVLSEDALKLHSKAQNGQGEPTVFRNVAIGACSELWNADYLSEKIGDENVDVHVSAEKKLDFINKNFLYRKISLREYLTRVTSSESSPLEDYFISPDESYYLRCLGEDKRKDRADIHKQFPSIADDINLPQPFNQTQFFSSVLRIASKGTQLWTHYDVMDNLLVQIVGKKTAILFPPSDGQYLYLHGDKSRILDPDNVDLNCYPLYANTTQYRAELQAGDILYIPALWFHNMTALDFSIAVNVFWKALDNKFYDPKDVYGNKDLIPAQRAEQGLNKALTTLSDLPEPYRTFYIQRMILQLEHKLVT